MTKFPKLRSAGLKGAAIMGKEQWLKPKAQVGRLALRVEGDNWNAYYALPDTMQGALYLGSIKMKFVNNPKHKNAFLDLMRECVADVLQETMGGARATWGDPQKAPEHERTKE